MDAAILARKPKRVKVATRWSCFELHLFLKFDVVVFEIVGYIHRRVGKHMEGSNLFQNKINEYRLQTEAMKLAVTTYVVPNILAFGLRLYCPDFNPKFSPSLFAASSHEEVASTRLNLLKHQRHNFLWTPSL